jgi:hypothetical protein
VAASEGGARDTGGADVVAMATAAAAPTDAELRALLNDCVALWNVQARVVVGTEGIEIVSLAGTFLLQRATPDMRPIRWLLHTPERRAANRPPRAAPSIGAALIALRNALGAETGNKLRIGATA